MAIQNDNTLVTKGDLKSLYTDKIAPYLGGGINYYYTDRIGKELKCGDYNIQGSPTIPVSTSQNTHLNLSARGGTHPSDFLIKDGNIVIPEGITVTIASNMVVNNNDNTSEANSLFMIYDYKNSANIGYASAIYHGNGVARTGSYTYNFTAPEGGAEIGIKCTYNAIATRKIGTESGLTITEIGRIVDPIKYVDNNSDLEETPVGNIISYMGNSVPKHYLACDGTTYSINTYPELEAFIINEFGSINYFGGDGATNWAVPDLRGEFLRGTGANSHANQGNGANVGEHQDATEHTTVYSYNNGSIGIFGGGGYWAEDNPDSTIYSTAANQSVGTYNNGPSESGKFTSRPTNTSVKYCIKYESTYHAFFGNATYKVSVAASVPSHSGAAIAITLDNGDIIGDASLVSGNNFIAPLDGLYLIGMNWSNNGVWDQNYMINVNGTDVYHVVGIGVTDMLQLQKGDVVTIKTSKTSAQSGRASFALVTSNYNPTIVSADTVYSENEQMIGYWKDGKPLYQKTITNTVGTSLSEPKQISMNINIDTFVNIFGYVLSDNTYIPINCPANDVNYIVRIYGRTNNYSIEAQKNTLQLFNTISSFVNKPAIITVQYTKTTDTASSLQIENSLLLNRPDLWEVDTEYHFGGGLYGIRKTGTFSRSVDGRIDITMVSSLATTARPIDTGGWIKFPDGWEIAIPGNWTQGIAATDIQFVSPAWHQNDKIFISTVTPHTGTYTYDFWVTYKK